MSVELESAVRLNALKNKADAVTGETSADLAGAVNALIAGYGSGGDGGGGDITLVDCVTIINDQYFSYNNGVVLNTKWEDIGRIDAYLRYSLNGNGNAIWISGYVPNNGNTSSPFINDVDTSEHAVMLVTENSIDENNIRHYIVDITGDLTNMYKKHLLHIGCWSDSRHSTNITIHQISFYGKTNNLLYDLKPAVKTFPDATVAGFYDNVTGEFYMASEYRSPWSIVAGENV